MILKWSRWLIFLTTCFKQYESAGAACNKYEKSYDCKLVKIFVTYGYNQWCFESFQNCTSHRQVQFENFQNIMTLKFIKFLFIMYSTKSLHPFVSIATSVLQSITPFALYNLFTHLSLTNQKRYILLSIQKMRLKPFFFLVIITFGS